MPTLTMPEVTHIEIRNISIEDDRIIFYFAKGFMLDDVFTTLCVNKLGIPIHQTVLDALKEARKSFDCTLEDFPVKEFCAFWESIATCHKKKQQFLGCLHGK